MRVHLAEIREEGLEINSGETPEELDLEYPDTAFNGEVRTRVRLTRLGETIRVTGAAEAGAVLECARCIKPFTVPLHLDIDTLFIPKTADAASKTERDPSGDEMENYYSGKTIDLGEFVREQILLTLPMVPVCRPDCRGLCGRCGKDLNLGECICHTEERNGPPQT